MRLENLLIQLPILIFSIILHEYAHGWMAERRGDDTARVMGRLTFNPLPHLDPIGSIILPLFALLAGGPIIGWAKPVPVNPYRLNDPKRDMIFVGLAGPASNILLAIACSAAMYIMKLTGQLDPLLFKILYFAVFINILLPVFNLVPVPPLDGSRIVAGLLPSNLSYEYSKIEPYGFFIVIFLLYTGVLWRIIIPIVSILVRSLVPMYLPLYV